MVGGKPLYRAFALILVKVKDTFRKVPARGALMRTYIIYAPKTDCSLCLLARPSHETAVASDKIAVYAQNSLENFPHISCSRQKVVRLFQKWYHFSESPTTFSHINCFHCSLSYRRQKVLPLFRVLAIPVVVSAVPVAVSAVPIARNAHPAHGCTWGLSPCALVGYVDQDYFVKNVKPCNLFLVLSYI